ncbi:MAG: PIG-L deacetylase family protein [Succinivibrionaceae bacterium]
MNNIRLQWDRCSEIKLEKGEFDLPASSGAILLKIRCHAGKHFWTTPKVSVRSNDLLLREQYFSPELDQEWYIDLTGLSSPDKSSSYATSCTRIKLETHSLSIADQGTLLFFDRENHQFLTQNNEKNLIIAPHPDDGELACASLYNSNCYVVVLTAGQKLTDLRKQYFLDMDNNLPEASKRKGLLRAFNSVTTPQLAGVPGDHCLCLGYLDATLSQFTSDDKPVYYDYQSEPEDFRIFNNREFASRCNLLSHPQNSRGCVKQELLSIIQTVKPHRVFVTNPFLDAHPDHRATGKILLDFLRENKLGNSRLYFYTIHGKRERDIYFGPAGSVITIPYFSYDNSLPPDLAFRYASSCLTPEQLKLKTIMMNSMYDLYFANDHRYRRHPTIKYFNSPRLGKAYYYQRFAKSNEVFLQAELLKENR